MQILEDQKEKKYPCIGIVSSVITNWLNNSKIYAITPMIFF